MQTLSILLFLILTATSLRQGFHLREYGYGGRDGGQEEHKERKDQYLFKVGALPGVIFTGFSAFE